MLEPAVNFDFSKGALVLLARIEVLPLCPAEDEVQSLGESTDAIAFVMFLFSFPTEGVAVLAVEVGTEGLNAPLLTLSFPTEVFPAEGL